MRTTEQCKNIIFNLGIEFGVSPRLIAERMLNEQDKGDMLSGVLTIDALRACVEVSKASGMFKINTPPKERIKTGYRSRQTVQSESSHALCHYQKPFVCHAWRNPCHCRLQSLGKA